MGIVIRQSLKGTALTYIGAALGFVTQFFIITKFIDPEIIGLTKVFYEVAVLFSGFALLGMSNAGMRFFPFFKDESENHHGFFYYFTVIPLIGTVLMVLVYLLCKAPITSFFTSKSPLFSDYYHLVIPLIFILTFWILFETYSNINLRIAFPKGVREVCLRLFLMADYLLYAFSYISLDGLMISVTAAYALCMLLDFIYIKNTSRISFRHDRSFISKDLKSKYLKYTGFLLLAAVSGNIMSQLDIFMLSSVKGLYSAGIYTIALYMSNVVDMPSRSITAISTPLAAEALKNGDLEKANELYKKVSIHQLAITGILLLLLWINMDNVFAILPNGEKFAEGKYVVLFLGLGKIITTTLGFGSILIQFSKYYYWTLFISIFLTVLTICTNLYFIPRMGISGAAFATLITTVISYSYQQYLVQRKVKGNPFTRNTLYLLVIIMALWVINRFIPSLTSISPWVDILVRTVIIAALAAISILKLKISPELNSMAGRFLVKLHINI